MAVFKNRTVNALNVHNASMRMLNLLSDTFGPVYALSVGLELWKTLAFMGGFFALRGATRLTLWRFTYNKDLASLLRISGVGVGLSVVFLAFSDGPDRWFLAFFILFAVAESIYWTVYHIYYTQGGEPEHRGKRYAFLATLQLLGAAFMAAVGGLIIKAFGHPVYFAMAIPFTLLAIAILHYAEPIRNTMPPWEWRYLRYAHALGNHITFAHCAFIQPVRYAWILLVYLTVGDVLHFALIIGYGFLLQFIAIWLFGHGFDKGHMRSLTFIVTLLGAAVIFSMAIFTLSLATILMIETLLAVTLVMLDVLLSSTVYNDAQKYQHQGWYWFIHEKCWDGMAIVIFSILTLAAYYGLDLQPFIAIASVGLIWFWYALLIYRKKPYVLEGL